MFDINSDFAQPRIFTHCQHVKVIMPFSHETGQVAIGELHRDCKPLEAGCIDCFQYITPADDSEVAMRLPNRPGVVATLPGLGLRVAPGLHETATISVPA